MAGLNARVIESIRLEFEERASKSAQLEFVSSDRLCDEAIA